MADAAWFNVDTSTPAYDAQELRRLDAVLLMPGVDDRFGAREGVRPGGADAASISGTTVTVANLLAVVYPGLTSSSGPYRVQIASDTFDLDPADGSNPRKDIIVLKIEDDDEDSSGEKQATFEYKAGTPASTPAEPSVDSGELKLCTVDVPESGGGSATLTYNAPYYVALGGILPVRDDDDLPTDGVYDGMAVWHEADQSLKIYDSTGFLPVASTKSPTQQIYTSSDTWTKPDGMKYCIVECQGGGGAGGGAPLTSASQSSAGAGGQGGAYARTQFSASQLDATETVTVGAGGSAVTGGDGGSGGSSSFVTFGTVGAAGGAGGQAIAASASTGFGHGADTSQSITGQIEIPGGGGGTGGRGGTQGCVGGTGGGSFLGTGGGGKGGPSSNGEAGKGYGGGGGGASNVLSSAAKPGGAGAAGVVIVTEFY